MDCQSMCSICGQDLENGFDITVVKLKGLSSFITKSKDRNDEKYKLWEAKSSITVHEICRKRYTALSAIKKEAPENIEISQTPQSLASEPINQTISHQSPQPVSTIRFAFDYSRNCLLCGKYLDKAHKQVRSLTEEHKQTLIKAATQSSNNSVLDRINNTGLCNSTTSYYHLKCNKNFARPQPTHQQHLTLSNGNVPPENDAVHEDHPPEIDHRDVVFQRVCHFIETSGGFEFHPSTLRDIMGDDGMSNKSLFKKLKDKYQNDIHISTSRGRETTILYRTSNIITDFYDKKSLDDSQKRAILTAAAKILQNEVKATKYDSEVYPPPNKFLENVESDIPKMMHVFLDEYSTKSESSKNNERDKVKKANIAHAMISILCPKNFISTLQLAAGVYIYRKTGSKLIVKILNRLGVVASYYNIQIYEASVIMDPPKMVIGDVFVHFVFDNTDHNVATLDGYETFHCLGGISIFCPGYEIVFEGGSIRLKKMPSAEVLASQKQISIVPIGEFDESVLKNIVFVRTSTLNLGESPAISPCYAAYVWAHAYRIDKIPLFRGFFEILTRQMTCETSFILCLPFINQPPSNLTTINTAIHYAIAEARKVNVKTPIITMDQPLHWKLRCLLAEGNLKAIASLGGFHLLMSFEGASCFVMDGSGLDDLWSTAYASESIKKMFTGHAFARALRAHILTFTALSIVICEMIDTDESVKLFVEEFFSNWNEDASPQMSDCNAEPSMKRLAEIFMSQLEKLKKNGPTATLWLQYFECATLILQFIEAQRLGNWQLHLRTIEKMLPIFHAAGHFAYAKSAQIYLQDMANLELSMDPDEFQKFVDGCFAVHRSSKAWSGIWPDMIIEQTLNRFFGIDLKHGRGVTPSVVARFLLGMPSAFCVMEALEDYTGVQSNTSEQHKDLDEGRMKRDQKDLAKFKFWLDQHEPFKQRKSLVSLSTGIVGDDSINCHKAFEVGRQSMETMIGKTAANIKLSTVYRVKPLSSAVNGMFISNDQCKSINVRIIFQRLSIVFNGNEEKTKEALRHELSPFPLCIFDEHGLMRKNTKSDLYKLCKTGLSSPEFLSTLRYVIDGGWLLHQVVWPHGKTYSEIMKIYLLYIRKHFGQNAVVVFDGYNNAMLGTKSYERYRRKERTVAADVEICETNLITLNREKFLSNISNKYQFVELLSAYLCKNQILSKVADEDADTLVVKTAVDLKVSSNETVAVVGSDIDLLILLIDQCPEGENIYFRKIVKQSRATALFDTKNHLYLKKYILFAHAFAGCDTTSAFFNKGKRAVISVLQKNPDLQEKIRCFYKEGSKIEDLFKNARILVSYLYNFKERDLSVHEMRYRTYLHLEGTVDKEKCLRLLPPSESALREHVKRVYYQMQSWLGKQLNPEKWGWKRTQTMLLPIMMTEPPAPEELLNTISCGCQTKCDTAKCSCKKAGLPCTRLCKYCNGESCENVKHENKNSEEYMIHHDSEIYEDVEESIDCHSEESDSDHEED